MPDLTPQRILTDTFGYTRFRGRQREIVDTLLAGKDALVLMPTGGGKSLCYQIPALLRPGVALVVSPLIALMADQVAALRLLGVRAAALHSGVSGAEQDAVQSDCQAQRLDLLYLAPERLLQPRTLAWLTRCRLALIAIDEAHCVSQWGHDFRPEYLQLAGLPRHFPRVPRIALTATAEPHTRAEILGRLGLDQAHCFVHSFDRPNIRYRVAERDQAQRQLLGFLRAGPAGTSGIVYCLSRRKTDATAAWLRGQGFDALAYHAGLDAAARAAHQRHFQSASGSIMVATVAFGMGIDKPDVRFVVHLDLPASLEAYYQETGRAGRDAEPADAWMLYGINDVVQRRRMIEDSEAPEERKRVERQKLEAMLAYCELTTCRRTHLLTYFGEENHPACGNCDTCLAPPATWDATEAARKALSAVYRTGQRFGARYITDHLRGAVDERGQRFGHTQLSTYGIGEDLSAKTWQRLLRQLVARRVLEVDEEFGGLRLGQGARALLRGESALQLRGADARTEAARPPRKAPADDLGPADQALFECLRALRSRLAEEQGVPPYVVFHDRTLLEMVRRKPLSEAELLTINGVGEKKRGAYGALFVDCIAAAQAAGPDQARAGL